MRILKTGCGNTQESFIEDRLTDGVNVIFCWSKDVAIQIIDFGSLTQA